MQNIKALKGSLIILLSSVLYGSYGVWSRLMGDSFEPFYQAWARSLVIMLIMLPFLMVGHSFKKIAREDWPGVAIFIGFCIFTQVPLYYAFNHAPIGTVQLIFYSVFVITAYIVGRIYLGEKITKIKLIALALAFVGLAILFGASVLVFAPLGLLLAGLNGIASGGEVSSSKKISSKYSPALLIFYGWVATLLTHLPISLALGEAQPLPQVSDAWLFLFIYSVVNALAFWLGIVGFKYVDASIGSLVGLMEIIFGILLGALIFGEKLTWSVLVSGSIIIFAAMLPDLVKILGNKKPN